MYKLSIKNPEVIINLDNGVYEFDSDSATGKTYLLSKLKLTSGVEPVTRYTLSDYNQNSVSYDRCRSSKIIMFDRYDMYAGSYKDLILECSKNSIILLDCKFGVDLGINIGFCSINLYKDKIKVYS